MCGLVAIVSPASIEQADLDVMRDRLEHRGPDGAQSWIGRTSAGHVALAHRRLAIIDPSAAADQPMWSNDRTLALVHNGEIYNYIELRAELESRGSIFSTRSDTEVLLEAYATWGAACLGRLNGMFAFAIWDARRGNLFLARDRFGEKPLFYARLGGGGIAFASEMKALLAHPGVSARVDETTLAAYVAGSYHESGEATMFAGVRRVPPAHAVVVSPSGEIERITRFWTPDYTVREDYDRESSAERFRELLTGSVRMRLRSDVPVGTSLSGGIDSSAIVTLLARMRNVGDVVTQRTFSARFDDDPTLSEGRHVDLVVGATSADAHSVTPTGEALIAESERLHWHQEEPFLSASIYLQWCVMRLALEHRTTVLLDGQGADELLGGYQSYFPSYQLDLLDRGHLATLVRDTRTFRKRLRAARTEYVDSTRRFDHDVALGLPRLLAVWLRSSRAVAAPAEGLPAATRGMRFRRGLAEAMQYNTLPLLLRYADRNAMAFSRETRFPFLDHTLVDWCAGLPDGALVHDGWQKAILRYAVQDLLPAEITWRADKVGYAAPLDVWLRQSLRDWGHERLFSSAVRDVEGYDGAVLRRLWDEHQSGSRNNSWAVWRWISLAEWLELGRAGIWKTGLVSPAPAVARASR